MGNEILLYVPNIIGYIRVLLTIAAFVFYGQPLLFVSIYVTSVIFDELDGYAARKLNQCSAFGAWYGYLVMFVEWLTFVSTHCKGPQWKATEDTFPWLVKKVMANGFKTAWGMVAIAGLHVLPIWLYAWETGIMTTILSLHVGWQYAGIVLLTLGRAIALSVELFYILDHVRNLLNHDPSRTQN